MRDLAPGQSETLDIGVVTGDLDAWCGIAGHRQQGMVLSIVTTRGDPDEDPATAVGGAEGAPAEHAHGAGTEGPVEKPPIDLAAEPGAGFTPYDAELSPLPPSDGPVTRTVTLRSPSRSWRSHQASPSVCGPSAAPPPDRCCTAASGTCSR